MPEITPAAPIVVAAFDFDGTLTRHDTLRPFLRRSLGWPRFLWALFLSGPWLAAYALRLMSNHQAKTRLLQVSFKGWSEQRAQAAAQDFVNNYLPRQWQPAGLQALVSHQQQGHRCVIISASPDLYLRAVVASLGVSALLCTEMELQGNTYSGRMRTPNCHGEEKVLRLQAWLHANLGADAKPVLYAYGDSPGDLPLLRRADHAWYREKPWSRA